MEDTIDIKTDINQAVYNRILIPFSRERDLHKTPEPVQEPGNLSLQMYDQKMETITHWARKLDFNCPVPPLGTLKARDKELNTYLDLFLEMIREIDHSLNNQTQKLFTRLFTARVYINLMLLEEIAEIEMCRQFAAKWLAIYTENTELEPSYRENRLQIIRCLHQIQHQAGFDAEKSSFSACIELVEEEITLAEKLTPADHILALTHYLEICLEHQFIAVTPDQSYINIEEFNHTRNLLQASLERTAQDPHFFSNQSYLLYRAFACLYQIRIINLLIKNSRQQAPSPRDKKELVILTTELIRLFYRQKADYNLFYQNSSLAVDNSKEDRTAFKKHLETNIFKNLSSQLSKLLNDKSRDTTGLLFILTRFFAVFNEFTKINLNNYKRILVLSCEYNNRSLDIVASIRYLQALYKIDIFEKNIRKIRQKIENKPVPAVIYYYNREIEECRELPGNLKNSLRLDKFITTIHIKEREIENQVMLTARTLEHNNLLTRQNLDWLATIRNELNNIFRLARNIDLIRDLGQLYCLFIDSYIKTARMQYREDFVQRATALKMQILDINPYYFAIALLYAKVGKLSLVQTNDSTLYYSMRKTRLTEGEKERIASFIPFSLNSMPDKEPGIHWEVVKLAVRNMNNPAIKSGQVAPAESRILKVLAAVINKITRQDIASDKLFAILYDETFIPAKNTWDLDPIILFYFNKYFSNKGRFHFITEVKGETIEIRLNLLMNQIVKDKINGFLKSLVENTPATDMDVTSQLEELSRLNEIPLVDESGHFLRTTLNQVRDFVTEEKAVFYEAPYVEFDALHYLSRLLENFFKAIAKQTYCSGFKFILNELIRNANDANLKKAHFLHSGQDQDLRYDLGMRSFAEKKVTHFDEYKKIIRDNGYRIKVVMHIFKNQFILSISNNYKIHPKEADIIHEKIMQSGRIKNTREAILKNPGTLEGAGSSIIIMILLLRKYGLYKDFFKVNLKEDQTVFRVTMPLSLVTGEQREIIAEELAKEIDRVPLLQVHIRELRRLLYDPDSTLNQIERVIQKNPALIIDILKMANSAYFSPGKSISSIREAVKILGLKRLNNVILVTNSFRLLKDKVSEKRLEALIKHSELTAFYAREIIRRKRISQVDEDDVYLAAILHDIGIIIVEGLHPDIYMKIQGLLQDKEIPLEVIENLAGGINHALVGYKIAEKWNLGDFILETIRYHHSPVDAPHYMNEVFIVYLANVYTYYNEGSFLYENIDPNVLVFFDLNSKEAVAEFGSQLKKAYAEFMSR